MSSQSNVGDRRTYEAGDQRNYKDSELREADRYNEGKENSHKPNDPKDERSIANRLANEEKKEKESEGEKDQETLESKIDSTKPAINHGNEPSKGAKIDQELKEEEEAELKKKGNFGPAAAN
ncbi:hypothetical protein CB0940_07430 [Cercospora beticola]|uniref:Conidiation-specific protein 6 n=2 Tax=Cercospora TaxID=29002 RepID=A0A2G5H8L2_CERBT|nr:hypothetical protein CB0940_07430 [Cercospora beticola]XP_044656356.1 uncharacterized protein CKM354_000515800 [Cercospora kikuchii]PIA88875.1 hypothetical protein CB0940_07430 [Cercospora beticola]WPB03377.1 hypothetical protein RHO25_008016 [Cercospora beticola]CAK1357901.1 unnamed protein product [Cercospora beticola]GIZ41869.1 hypothetical protein CKM354_000515800 [Cercospora kikuchii]